MARARSAHEASCRDAEVNGEHDGVVGTRGSCPQQTLTFFLLPPHPPVRYLCDKVVPGNRVTIMGIYSIKKFGLTSNRGRDRVGVGIRSAYIRVLGIQVDTDGSGEWALGQTPSSVPGPPPSPPVCTPTPTLCSARQPGRAVLSYQRYLSLPSARWKTSWWS